MRLKMHKAKKLWKEQIIWKVSRCSIEPQVLGLFKTMIMINLWLPQSVYIDQTRHIKKKTWIIWPCVLFQILNAMNFVVNKPVSVFQNLIHLSAVPPPEAKRPWWWGDHAMAFTAAMWSVNVYTGWLVIGAYLKQLIDI